MRPSRLEPGVAVKTMTIRNVSTELASDLEAEQRRRGLSLNRTVLSLMQEALGIPSRRNRSNGLRRMAGSGIEDDFRRFEEAVAPFGEVDAATHPPTSHRLGPMRHRFR